MKPKDKKSENHDEKPVLKILRDIQEGIIKGEELSADIRQDCVEHMWISMGYQVEEIAGILNVSGRTIKRDKTEIKKRNAQKPSADYALETIGELIQKATVAHEHMMKLARSEDGSLQEKAQAGYYVGKLIMLQVKSLQSMGLLPEKAMQIESEVHHHQEEETSVEELKEELARLEKIAAAKENLDPEILKLIGKAKQHIALAEAKSTIGELKNKIEKDQGTSDGSGQ